MSDLMRIQHEKVRRSNFLINSAMDCSKVEKRALYYISLIVKKQFEEKNLGVPDNWKDLYIHLDDKDIAKIGGTKNIPHTYNVLKNLERRLIYISKRGRNGEHINGCAHWIDSFFFNKETCTCDVRLSPEIMPYLIDVKDNFTTLDIGTAMALSSKESQKMYEICCQYSGNYRHTEKETGFVYKKNIVSIPIDRFRTIFNLDEKRNERTGKVERGSRYKNFNAIKSNILLKAQAELYMFYKEKASDVWFDFLPGPRKGRGGKVSSILIVVYSRENPKKGLDRPWQKGDDPLDVYEDHFEQEETQTPRQRLHANPLYDTFSECQEQVLLQLLKKYLSDDEAGYYLRMTLYEARKGNYRTADAVMQMIQVIQDKEKQKKFRESTAAYKRNNLVNYVFRVNLQREFGWHIDKRKTPDHLRKHRKR